MGGGLENFAIFLRSLKTNPLSISLIKSPPLGQHTEQEILSTTFLGSLSKNSFFLSSVIEWNNLDKSIRSFESLPLFKKSTLQFIQPNPKRTLNCHNPIGIKLITRLGLGLSHLRDINLNIIF